MNSISQTSNLNQLHRRWHYRLLKCTTHTGNIDVHKSLRSCIIEIYEIQFAWHDGECNIRTRCGISGKVTWNGNLDLCHQWFIEWLVANKVIKCNRPIMCSIYIVSSWFGGNSQDDYGNLIHIWYSKMNYIKEKNWAKEVSSIYEYCDNDV